MFRVYVCDLLLLIALCRTDGRNITVVLLVPHSGARSFNGIVEVAMDMSMTKVNTASELDQLRAQDIVFEYIRADTLCDVGQGLYELVQIRNSAHAFIGPACDSVCLPAGLLAGKWNTPMISYGCSLNVLSNHEKFPTFVRTSAIYVDMAYFFVDFIKHHSWNRVVIVEGPEEIWRETAGHFQVIFEESGIFTSVLSIPSQEPHELLEKHLLAAAKRDGMIFVVCAHALDLLLVMCAAETGNLLDGNHVFMVVDFSYMTKTNIGNRPCDIEKDLEGLLDVTIKLDTEYKGYQDFVRQISSILQVAHGIELGIHMGMIYDAVYLYAVGLNEALAQGYNETHGKYIVERLLNHTFNGITGKVQINRDGKRTTNFSIHNIQMGIYNTIAHGNSSLGGIYFEDTPIFWPGGSTVTPLGRPACGWDNEYCIDTSNYIPVFAAVGCVLLVVISVTSGMTIYIYRKKKYQERIESMGWKISHADLDFRTYGSVGASRGTFWTKRSTNTNNSRSPTIRSHKRANSFDSNVSHSQLYTKIASYKGKMLAVKYINKPYVAVTQALIKEINEIRSLNHRNVNPLIGACVEPMKTCIFSLYCPKGSLQDVLGNDNVKLDNIFKVAFVSDIAKGMHYIHSSNVHVHGRLKSSNVYIDQHWTCRVGDIMMPVFRDGERSATDDDTRESYQLLWTAPEHLRDPDKNCRGSQKGDVYSFGILLQEVMLRTGPYGENNLDPDDILDRVIQKETPPFRPNVPAIEGIPEIDDVMRMCWEEVPIFRPTFGTVLESLKKFNNGKTTSLVDQMVHMMEKYADHLEELVQERTEQLEIEQKRTEDLLCRMLPRSIANSLKVGKMVAPETYESVTIFFSDIVGFTALSSESTPIEVVNFLNDLYTCFDTIIEDYDVYKVETIGDAYMVVSGLPVRNGIRHAGEIASMALDLLSSVTTFKVRHKANMQLQMRVGIHSGSVCAGVVGLKMPRYCLFGDAVNYASRMESSGLALRIHVSPECKAILEALGGFKLETRGVVKMKGKGEIETFFLLSKDGFTKPLPDLRLAASPGQHEFK